MATGGSKLGEVIADQHALELPPGMCGSGESPVKSGTGGGEGPTFKAPSRSGGGGSKRKTTSKTHSEE